MEKIIIEYKKEYSFRERMLLWLLDNVLKIHALVYSKRPAWGINREQMKAFPSGTLGNELGHFLEREQLQPVDKMERHDAYHILLDYNTHLHDEAAMQFYLVANGKRSPFTIATAAFTVLVMPDIWSQFRTAWKRGQQARSIAKWDFKELLGESYTDLKRLINRQPVYNDALLRKIEEFERK